MRYRMVGVLSCAAGGSLVALLMASGVAAAAAAWTVVPSPSPGVSGDQLFGVASVSADDVWAVGQTTTSAGFATLAEHWNGTAWSVVPTTNKVPSERLNGVAAVSSSDVWAVGSVSTSSPPVTEQWNGTAWKTVAPAGKQDGFLTGVTAVSAKDVWAVGEFQKPGVGLQTLIEQFTGHKWHVVPSPDVGTLDELTGVTAVSATDVWAVGFAEANPSEGNFPQTLVLHWDGTSWSVVPSADPDTINSELTAVTAVSATDVWAVGEFSGDQTLAEQWNGTSWNAVTSPAAGQLNGVAAVSASNIWAVGSFSDPNTGITSTVIENWDGTSWTVVPSPDPSANENVLAAASADPTSGQAWAVGEFFNNTTSTRQTLTEFNP